MHSLSPRQSKAARARPIHQSFAALQRFALRDLPTEPAVAEDSSTSRTATARMIYNEDPRSHLTSCNGQTLPLRYGSCA